MGILLNRLFGDEKAEHDYKMLQEVKRANDLEERKVKALEELVRQGRRAEGLDKK